jgi:hypothetical protein
MCHFPCFPGSACFVYTDIFLALVLKCKHEPTHVSYGRSSVFVTEKNVDVRGIKGQIEETIKRIAEIKIAFGEFKVEEEKPLKVKLPRLPAVAAATGMHWVGPWSALAGLVVVVPDADILIAADCVGRM